MKPKAANMVCYAKFVVGNTYSLIPEENAELDRSKQHRKVHDWTVFLDVVDGDKDSIAFVTFDMGPSFSPKQYSSYYPMEIRGGETSPNGSASKSKWRFQSRHQTYGGIMIRIHVTGVGQSVLLFDYKLRLAPGGKTSEIQHFVEDRAASTVIPTPLPDQYRFSLELEFLPSKSCLESGQTFLQLEKNEIEAKLRDIQDRPVIRGSESVWKLFNDPTSQSLVLSSSFFGGSEGLDECRSMLQEILSSFNGKIKLLPRVIVYRAKNHVLLLEELCKICLNFIKYEDAIDKAIPGPVVSVFDDEEREEEVSLPKSNRQCVPGRSNKARHDALSCCRSAQELLECMNRNETRTGDIYKLNIKLNDDKTQLEFRLGTVDHQKLDETISIVLDWIRFSVLFVSNSIHYRKPAPLLERRSLEEQIDMMFNYVIKDRYLAEACRYHTSSSVVDDMSLLAEPHRDLPIGNASDGWPVDVTLEALSTLETLSAVAMQAVPLEVNDSLQARKRPRQNVEDDSDHNSNSFESTTLHLSQPNRLLSSGVNNPELSDNPNMISDDSNTSTPLTGTALALQYNSFGSKAPADEPGTSTTSNHNQRTSAIGCSLKFWPLTKISCPVRKITLHDLNDLHATRQNNLKKKRDHLTYRDLWYILDKINRPKDRDMIRRVEEILEYARAKPCKCIDVIMASVAPHGQKEEELRRRRLLTVTIGGVKLTETRPKTKPVESLISFTELQDVLEILGKPEPTNLEEGVTELDRYLEEQAFFHLLVQFPNDLAKKKTP
jgi:hypothetical protein